MAPSQAIGEKGTHITIDADPVHEDPFTTTIHEDDTEYNPNPSAKKQKTKSGAHGYEVPEEQFRYADDVDTGYRGAGGS